MSVHAWDKQSNESSKAHAAFSLYLAQGPTRTLAKVAAECTKSESLIRRWSARWSWVERAAEYDAYTAAQEAKVLIAREVASRMRRARHGELIESAGTFALQRIAGEVQAGTRELTPREAADLVRTGAHVEHQALSQTPGVQVTVGVNVASPPPVSPELMARAAFAFVAAKTSNPELERLAMEECNRLAAK